MTLGLLQYLTPALQLAWGVWVLHEDMPASRWIGFGLIWCALAVFTADAIGRIRRESDRPPRLICHIRHDLTRHAATGKALSVGPPRVALVSDSFVHLHNHTEYSMLDGAAKIAPLFAEASRLGMSAVGMTDHGNMYGASEFYNEATKAGIKPIIGIEAYVAPASRFDTKRVLWGDRSQKSDDVSGSGAYTHMTMVAENATGLRNLFKLSSLASIEGQLGKWARMDEELIATHHEGIIATTGCPSGEIQTRLRLGHDREALEAAAKWQEIWGPDNFFLELMDHGLSIERRVREGLLDIGKQLGIPPLATNDCHYVTKDASVNHEALLCIQTGKTLSDPTRFKFDGDGYYLKSAEEMRAIWDSEVPGACDSHATDRRARAVLLRGLGAPRSHAGLPGARGIHPGNVAPQGSHGRSAIAGSRPVPPMSTSRAPSTRSASSSRWGSRRTFSSSATSSTTRRTSASASGRVEVRPPVRSSRTRWASPTSTRFRTACCSSGS